MRKPPQRLRKANGQWREWSPEEIKRLTQMRKERRPVKEIAAELGRTPGAVNQKIKIFRLTRSCMPPEVKLTRSHRAEIAREDTMHLEARAASQQSFVQAMQRAGYVNSYCGPDPAKAVRFGPQNRG